VLRWTYSLSLATAKFRGGVADPFEGVRLEIAPGSRALS